ncbi:MAG TPA: hypothetical protein VE196_03505, partial [Pseudonocardiaceae bacterium]|nr:hypothetical protein [Pseudonocardiaceae bacterium]
QQDAVEHSPPSRFYTTRIGFTVGETYHPVAWFDPRGDDLYWGSSSPGQYTEPVPLADGSIPLTVPEDIDQLPVLRAKHSYHASGRAHLKIENVLTGTPGHLTPPAAVRSPLYLGTLITRRADQYPPGKRPKPSAGHVAALQLNDQVAQCRHQLEFWVAPPGEHQMPAFWAVTPQAEPAPARVPQYTQSISPNLILVMRNGVHEPGEFSDWEPDAEIWITNRKAGATESEESEGEPD